LDKAIVTTLLIVAGVIAATMLFSAVYPAVIQSSNALVGMKARIDERFSSQLAVIHACTSPDYTDVALVWVKNIGASSIKAVERCDVFFGPEGNYQRIPHDSGDPHWEYAVENDTYWKPGSTLKVTVDLSYVLVPGERYFFKMTTPNGVSTEYYFSPNR